MPIDFSADRWERVQRQTELWWQNKLNRPLIQVRLRGKDPRRPASPLPFHEFTAFYDFAIPAEQVIDRIDYELCCTEFLGDAFPHFWPNFGAGVLGAFMGARPELREETVWFHAPAEQKPAEIELKVNWQHPWLQRLVDLIEAGVARWQGQVQIGMTDLGGNLDLVSTFLPGEKLLLALFDDPEEVERLTWQAHQAWWQVFGLLNNRLQKTNPGYSCWTPLFSRTPYYMLQCDFSYMIGPDAFHRFILPELRQSAEKLDHAFYHLDGVNAKVHLDDLLAIEAIRGIQWVPGDAAPDIGCWPEIYRRITAKGKHVQFFNVQAGGRLDTIDQLIEQTGRPGAFAAVLDADISQRNQVIELLQKYEIEP
ncbi:MAG TPA: hypothetical protein PKW76_11270 [bacterium]|nr:hypothetical protein [bacterium]HPG46252.1 hypothetical protein [bacterium]HPM98554.1 hypothetical protein [bacterium]